MFYYYVKRKKVRDVRLQSIIYFVINFSKKRVPVGTEQFSFKMFYNTCLEAVYFEKKLDKLMLHVEKT